MIRDDLAWHAVELEDVAIVDVGDSFGSNLSCTRYQMSLIRQMIDIDRDRVVAT